MVVRVSEESLNDRKIRLWRLNKHKAMTELLKVLSEERSIVPFKFRKGLKKYSQLRRRERWIYTLKSRRLGYTTTIAGYNFIEALFEPNTRICVIAHTDSAAKKIARIYWRFWLHLPDWMKEREEFASMRSSAYELILGNGSRIVTSTANTESFRGEAYDVIHMSEFAFYADIEATLMAVLQTATPGARVDFETTANGMNEAHAIWEDPEVGYAKHFDTWVGNVLCESEEKPKRIPGEIVELGKQARLNVKQLWWITHRYQKYCRANLNILKQEYPRTPEEAFITTGRRFFASVYYPGAQAVEGYKQFAPPKVGRLYSMGIDTATGDPNGDFSAFAVWDVTNKAKPQIVSSFYKRTDVIPFARIVIDELKKYNALAVPEVNGVGLTILTQLQLSGWGFVYRRLQYDKIDNQHKETLGFTTTRKTRTMVLVALQELVATGMIEVVDERLKAEINAFIYDKRGKPIASTGHHDDMIFAHALAWEGAKYIEMEPEMRKVQKPSNIRELLLYELQTGNTKRKKGEWLGEPDEEPEPSPMQVLFNKQRKS